jgi:hypothetical protein
MSPPRESQGSTKIARQTRIDRMSQRTRNSVIPRRASKNSREFDAQSFLKLAKAQPESGLINFDLLELGLHRSKITANREAGSWQGEGGTLCFVIR